MLSMFKKESDDFTIIALSKELQILYKEVYKKANKKKKVLYFSKTFLLICVSLFT